MIVVMVIVVMEYIVKSIEPATGIVLAVETVS